MPNWCNNTLTVQATEEFCNELAQAATRGEMLEFIKPLGEWDYDQCVAEWGTKWDINCIDVSQGDGEVTVIFDTAWSPPCTAYETLVEHPAVESVYASYVEPGMDFGGEWEDGDDRFVDNLCEAVKNKDAVAVELDEQYGYSEWFEDDEEEELTEWMADGAEARGLTDAKLI